MAEPVDASAWGQATRGLESGLRRRGGPWVYGFVVLGLLAAFLVSVRSVLTPPVLFGLFVYAVWPFAGSRVHVRLLTVAAIAVLLWLLDTTGLLLAPFLLAFIFAYILDPLVDWLQERRLPRSVAVALLALPVLGVLALIVFVVVPAVAAQVSLFISNVPEYVDAIQGWVRDLRRWVLGFGIPGVTNETLPQVGEIDAEAVADYLAERQAALAERGAQAVLGIGRGIGAVLVVFGYIVLTPIVTFFLLRDWDRFWAAVSSLVPSSRRPSVIRFASEYDDLLSRYLRGQLLLALGVGVFIGGFLRILDFPYALLIGLIAGVMNIVPYLGFATSIVAALLISLFSGAILTSLLKVAIVYGAEQVLEQVAQPIVVGKSVDLHPVWLLLALALCSFFFGFVGLLLAVPLAVVVKLVAVRAIRRYRASSFYGEASEDAGSGESAGTVDEVQAHEGATA